MNPPPVLTLELPADSPTWGEPEAPSPVVMAWRMERTLMDRAQGRELERNTPSPEPFIWLE